MPHDKYKSLYLHIPFCKSRCAYCDFTTTAVDAASPEVEQYIEWMIKEIRRQSKADELTDIETIYIGGGTPTHLGTKKLTEILYAISVSVDLNNVKEFSIEANPESINERLIADIWALGVDRISIGVQSFNNNVLQTLNRPHVSDDAKRAIQDALTRFENVSIDLMCGLPGQDINQFKSDIETAINLGVKHLSVYPLAIEQGTLFEKLLLKNRLELPSEDEQTDMMCMAHDVLENAGFNQYEVASYAIPGYECRHNISYWTAKPYLGIGKSAATMTQNESRRMRVQDGQVTDDLNKKQMAAEDAMLRMRMNAGIPNEIYLQLLHELPELKACLLGLSEKGLCEKTDRGWIPTKIGWLYGNELYGALLDLAP